MTATPIGKSQNAQCDGKQSFEDSWLEREKKLVDGISKIAEENWRAAMIHKKWHLFCSVLVMVCAVLAPLFVASSSLSNNNVFGLEAIALNRISLFLTVLLGVTEGLRRIFRFEQRWYAYYSSCNNLVQRRETYLDDVVEKPRGSAEWKDSFRKLHRDVQSIFNEQNKLFFQGVLEQSELSGSSSGRPKGDAASDSGTHARSP